MEALLLLALMWLGVGSALAGWLSRSELAAAWREPVLKRPVLIVESDDWGAGPPEQAQRLDRIAAALDAFADRDGHKPVMTLGLVLGVADGPRILANGLRNYYRKSLEDRELSTVLAAIRRGEKRGVFALQLHGGEHYWPPALVAAARSDPRVAAWLAESTFARTEELPTPLQSRWIDASELPSKPLVAEELTAVVRTEAEDFRRILGREPTVAVPPTFVWNAAVEAAWSEAGVQFVVTPGRRYEARDVNGRPCAGGVSLANGDKGVGGLTYLVRDVYFEPARGHVAERALRALASKTRAGRPTLLETHRANFLGDKQSADTSVRELERLLDVTVARFPDVAFLSTEELGSKVRGQDPKLIEHSLAARLHVWLRRLWQIGRVRKLGYATGAVALGWFFYAVTRPAASAGLRR